MNVNVASLRIEANKDFVRIFPVSHQMKDKAEETGKDYDASPRYLVLSHKETKHAILCARGEASFYPYFDDGIHKVRVTPRGMEELYLDSYITGTGGKFEQFYFTLPGDWLADLFELALDSVNRWRYPGYTFVYNASNGELARLTDQYASRVKWEYATAWGNRPDVYTRLQTDLTDDRAEGLQRALDGLERIGLNYSDGEPSIVHLRFDIFSEETPCSYYFWIEDAQGNRIMNGGIIAHQNYKDGERVESWSYSTHT